MEGRSRQPEIYVETHGPSFAKRSGPRHPPSSPNLREIGIATRPVRRSNFLWRATRYSLSNVRHCVCRFAHFTRTTSQIKATRCGIHVYRTGKLIGIRL